MNEPGTLVCTCGHYIEYHTPYVIETLGGVYSINKDGKEYYCRKFVLDTSNTENTAYLKIVKIKKRMNDLETCLAELLEAYIEENGGDMPTSDNHPAHDARKLLGENNES